MSAVASLAASAAVAARPAASARSAKPVRRSALVVRASDAAAPVAAEETYEVTLAKPIGVKFARGNDGGAYVAFVPPEPEYDVFEIGDKILQVSASFGEIWDADSYARSSTP